jgi:hypothetical protein
MPVGRRKEYAARVAWTIAKRSGRYTDYFQKRDMMKRTKKQMAATRKMIAARKAQLKCKKVGRSSAKRPSGAKKRNKGRSPAQIRATNKMIRASRARRSGKKAKPRKNAKRVEAGRKAARTRARNMNKARIAKGEAPKMSAYDGNYINGKRPKRVKQPRRKGGGRQVSGTFKKSRTKARKAYLRKHPENNRPTKTSGRLRVGKKPKKTSKKIKKTRRTPAQIAATKKMLAAAKRARKAAKKGKSKKAAKMKSSSKKTKKVTKKIKVAKRKWIRDAQGKRISKKKAKQIAEKHAAIHEKRLPAGPRSHSELEYRALKKARAGKPLTEREALALNKTGAPAMAAFDNPITPGGVVGVSLVGGFGAFVGEMTDRMLATHAFTQVGSVTVPAGDVIPADQKAVDIPGKGELFNKDAVASRMGLVRWGVGITGTFLPMALSAIHMPSPLQTGLRGLGIGWGIRTIMKGGIDLSTLLLGKTQFGERLLQPELRAVGMLKAGGSPGGGSGDAVATLGAAPRRQTGTSGCCAACDQGKPCVQQPPAPPEETGAAGEPTTKAPPGATITHVAKPRRAPNKPFLRGNVPTHFAEYADDRD